jgi:hypothetical protein
MFSLINLPFTKDPFSFETSLGRGGLNVVVMNFDKILYETLQREIRQNQSKEDVFCSVEMSVRNKELIHPSKLNPFLEYLIMHMRSRLMISINMPCINDQRVVKILIEHSHSLISSSKILFLRMMLSHFLP